MQIKYILPNINSFISDTLKCLTLLPLDFILGTRYRIFSPVGLTMQSWKTNLYLIKKNLLSFSNLSKTRIKNQIYPFKMKVKFPFNENGAIFSRAPYRCRNIPTVIIKRTYIFVQRFHFALAKYLHTSNQKGNKKLKII